MQYGKISAAKILHPPYLVRVRSGNKYDWALPRNIECATGPNFSEKDVYDHPPEEQNGFVGHSIGRHSQ
jgi:hypothetical protein